MRYFKVVVLTTLVASTPLASAGETLTEVKQGLSFSVAGIAGALAGGPVGLVLGSLGGVYLGEQFRRADALPNTEQALARVEQEKALLLNELEGRSSELTEARQILDRNQAALDSRLEFEILFPTGIDDLREADRERLEMLAAYLARNPKMRVQLDGYADPRGTDEYNNVLAKFRAQEVANTLQELGVPEKNVSVHSHGSSRSLAEEGDYDAYARERRVSISVVPKLGETLARGD